MDSGMVTMSECDVLEDANPYHSWSANRNEWKALYTCYGREDANPYHSSSANRNE